MLEEWLINPRINGEYWMKIVGIGVLKASDEGTIMNFQDIKEENMQQKPMRSNNKFQQTRSNMYDVGDKLDIEIDRVRTLMMKVHEKLNTNVIRVGKSIRKMNVQKYINKESGKIQHKVLKRGRLKKI